MAEGFGQGEFGTSLYGLGTYPPLSKPPIITPINPRPGEVSVPQSKPISISLTDDVGVAIETLTVSVNEVNVIVGGVGVNGASFESVLNNSHGYDISITTAGLYEIGSRQNVQVFVKDVEDVEALLFYSFTVGVGPRLLKVSNPVEGLLVANFNQPMRLSGNFFFAGNWRINPISDGAAPLEIVEVISSTARPDVAHLRYTGGGSTYQLLTQGLLGDDGTPLEAGFRSAYFDIVFGEEEKPTVRLFNSVFGPLGISQRPRLRRTIDDFTANRSIAVALDEQFRLRFQQLDNTVGRDGRAGKLRT